MHVQGISIRLFPGLVNIAPAVAYHFCLNLPAAFPQPGNGLIEIPCMQFLALLCVENPVSFDVWNPVILRPCATVWVEEDSVARGELE